MVFGIRSNFTIRPNTGLYSQSVEFNGLGMDIEKGNEWELDKLDYFSCLFLVYLIVFPGYYSPNLWGIFMQGFLIKEVNYSNLSPPFIYKSFSLERKM